MGSGDFSLSRGGFGTGVPGNKALQMCVHDGGGRKGGKGRKKVEWEGEREKGRRRKEEEEKSINRSTYTTCLILIW